MYITFYILFIVGMLFASFILWKETKKKSIKFPDIFDKQQVSIKTEKEKKIVNVKIDKNIF